MQTRPDPAPVDALLDQLEDAEMQEMLAQTAAADAADAHERDEIASMEALLRTPVERPRRRPRLPRLPTPARRAIRVASWIITILFVGPALIQAVPQVIGQDDSFLVLSGSMVPAFDAGDVIFVRIVDGADLAVGDVITFHHPPGSKRLITHRIVEVTSDARGPAFRTQGDANDDVDPWLVPAASVVGKQTFTLPDWGHILSAARTPAGYVGLVLLPGLAVLGIEMRNIYREMDALEKRKKQKDAATPTLALLFVAALVLTALAPVHLSDAAPRGGVALGFFSDGEAGTDALQMAAHFPTRCSAPVFPAHDPGHAYEDVDGDLVYTNGVDTHVEISQLSDGHHAAAASLIVPPSVGAVLVNGTLFLAAAPATLLLVGAPFSATGAVTLEGGSTKLTAAITTSVGDVSVTTGAATLSARLETASGALLVEATSIAAECSDLVSGAAIALTASGGELHLDGAQVTGVTDVTLTGQTRLDVRDARLQTGGGIVFSVGGASPRALVHAASLDDADDTAQASPASLTVVGTPAFGTVAT